MGYTIAICGKGGTGKTTIASLIIKALTSQKRGSVLAVDADPNSNLNEALGVSVSGSPA
jgi:CO dehydrogenase maturation factor